MEGKADPSLRFGMTMAGKNSEARMQVRASREPYGLLTASLPANALVGSCPEPNGHGSFDNGSWDNGVLYAA
jgi:hypothetical protein